jgi:hypothetical protein
MRAEFFALPSAALSRAFAFPNDPIRRHADTAHADTLLRATQDQSVTAPREADLTWLAYFASTPLA